jgi:hypothetical protein
VQVPVPLRPHTVQGPDPEQLEQAPQVPPVQVWLPAHPEPAVQDRVQVVEMVQSELQVATPPPEQLVHATVPEHVGPHADQC